MFCSSLRIARWSSLALVPLALLVFIGLLAAPSRAAVPGNVASQKSPAAVTFNGNRYVFSIDGNNHVNYNVFNGSTWSGSMLVPNNGTTYAAVAPIVYNSPNGTFLYVFLTGTTGHIFYTYTLTGSTWSSYISVPGNGTTSPYTPVGVAQLDTRIFLALTGTDGRIYYQFYNGASNSWSGANGYSSVPNQPFTQYSPSPVVIGGILHLFFTGHDNGHPYLTVYNGSQWSSINGILPDNGVTNGYVSAAAYNGSLYVFLIGTDGHVYYNVGGPSTNGSSSALPWSGYTGIPNAVSFTNLSIGTDLYNNHLDAYFTGVDNALYLVTFP